jgi:transcriptional regulator with XRE-family HTH domain
MRKSVYTAESKILCQTLTEARKASGLHQSELAHRLGRDQSVISNIERGQRRVDVVEFYLYARAMGYDPVHLFQILARNLAGVAPDVDIA